MAIMQGCSALQGHSEQDSSLTSSFNTFEASLNIKQIDGVHQDYIHQVIYLMDLLDEINIALDGSENLDVVMDITSQLNDTTSPNGVGTLWGEATYELQTTYYVLPTSESPSILGRKAVGTGIYVQYVEDLLQETQGNLNKSKAGTLDNFIMVNTPEFSSLEDLTTAYYAQANKADRGFMNAGFDYEKDFLVHFTQPVDQFYR